MRVKEHGKVGGCCSPAHLGGFLHSLFPTAGILGSVNIHSIYVYEYVQYVYSMWIFQGCVTITERGDVPAAIRKLGCNFTLLERKKKLNFNEYSLIG